ncbi:hypothetical protein JCGZ_14754 [Jatropha curcas]|uniref:LOB domain-containing protein n=1 Tax=Jatropha curcas TaxID=180498 RepID=A0A067K8U3_JATCU|nr:hypothetical protein JCGZ_14754 [Jatropha curcas]
MAKNPFVFPSTFSNSESSIPSSSSSSPSPSFNSSSSYPSSPSLNSPFQPSHQSLPFPPSQTSSSHFSLPSKDVVGPCAACKILRRQCTDKCYLASYFPSTTEPHNFTVVDSLFRLNDVHEFLQRNSNSSSYVPLLLLLRDTSKDGNQLQANPSNNGNIVPYRTNVNINGKPMLANSENSKAHSYSSSSKPLNMFGTNDTGTLTSPANQLGDNNNLDLQADMVGLNMLKGNVDRSDKVARKHNTKGFTLVEVNSVRASAGKVVCCDLSSDGKLLASGGHDNKVVLWDTERENLKSKTILEEHSSLITDVRFSPSMRQLVTSSFDKTVKVWDTNEIPITQYAHLEDILIMSCQ